MCGELWEELVRCRCVDDEDRQAPDGGRCLCKNSKGAVSMLGEQGERYALHGSRCDHLRGSINLIEKAEIYEYVPLRGFPDRHEPTGKFRGAGARREGA